MKLTAGLLAALAGCSAAAPPEARVYIVSAGGGAAASTPPSMSPSLARLVLLQRLAPMGQGPSMDDVPGSVDVDGAVDALIRFGKQPPAMLDDGASEGPRQLLVMLEDMTEQQMEDLERDLGTTPAFTVADAPSRSAHDELVRLDLGHAALTGDKCGVREVTNPLGDCWAGKQAVVAKYSIDKERETVEIGRQVSRKMAQLRQLAEAGELETALVLLPSAATGKSWSDKSLELRRRQAEHVITSAGKASRPATTSAAAAAKTTSLHAKGPVPACFGSEAGCVKATGNCSEHGSCINKYGEGSKEACYACHCLGTRSASGSLTHWAGPTCAKADVSVSFWLLVGFTVALVGILSLSVSMLFNVGEEKLPGVIGAGVSRSK